MQSTILMLGLQRVYTHFQHQAQMGGSTQQKANAIPALNCSLIAWESNLTWGMNKLSMVRIVLSSFST